MRERLALLIVVSGYGLAQWLLVDLDRYLSYDEAVYYSQVAQGAEPIFLSASRSRGAAWLIAPLAGWGASLWSIRLALSLLATAGCYAAFAAWRPGLGDRGTAAAAAVFCASWVGLYYGSEISPNLPVALLLTLGAGLLLYAEPHQHARRWASAASLCAAVVVRPTDATAAMGVALLGLLLFDRKRIVPCTPPAALALVLGWLPWLLEAYSRFDGPSGRLTAARRLADSKGAGRTFLWYLSMNDGMLYQKRPHIDVSWQAALWWGVLLGLTLLGVWRARSSKQRHGPWTAALAAAALFAVYLLTAAARPRYLLPVYALMAPAAGLGLLGLMDAARSLHARAAVAPLLLLAAPGLLWHGASLRTLDRKESEVRNEMREVGDVLAEAAGGKPCAALVRWGMAPIVTRAGCHGIAVWGNKSKKKAVPKLLQRACQGEQLFALVPRGFYRGTPLGKWRSRAAPGIMRLYYPEPNGQPYCKRLEATESEK